MLLNLKSLNHNEMVVMEILLNHRNIGAASIERLAAKEGYVFPEKQFVKSSKLL